MNPYALPSLISAAVCLFWGIYVFIKNPKGGLNQTFSLLVFLLSFWSFSEFVYRQTSIESTALLWTKLEGLAWSFFPAVFLHFVLVFAQKEKILRNPFFYLVSYLPGFVFAYLSLTTGLLVADYVRMNFWGYEEFVGPAFSFFSLYYFICSVIALFLCFRIFRKSQNKYKKIQAKIIFFATLIALAGGTITDMIMPLLNIGSFIGASYSMFIFISAIAYAIIRYEFLAILPVIAPKKALETMAEALFVLDPHGTVEMINPAAVSMLGFKTEELLEKPIGMILKDNLFEKERYEEIIKRGEIKNIDANFLTTEKKLIPVNLSIAAVRDRYKRFLGTVMVARDRREIEGYINQLWATKAGLEEKIKERTKELKAIQSRLEKEVDRKVFELKKRYEELKKFEKLAVGRELFMADLKKENKKLKERLLSLETKAGK